jgi:CBS domain-containing protein
MFLRKFTHETHANPLNSFIKSRGTFIAPKNIVRVHTSVHTTLQGESAMQVKDIMTPEPKAIWLTQSLTDAARLMWENDCGVLPIIKDGRTVVGVITDRDVCMAATMNARNPSAVSVEEVMTGEVFSVTPDDDVDQALQLMRDHQVHRLPVISEEGELQGILSLNDVILNAKTKPEGDSIAYGDLVTTFQAIGQHRLPMQASSVAASS